jgi:cytochrome c553
LGGVALTPPVFLKAERLRLIAALVLIAFAAALARAQSFDERLTVCLACHGEKGASETPEVPSLGGQPSPYVLIQLYMFREKLRISEIMNDVAKDLTDADLQRFADTIAKLPPPPASTEPADPALLDAGRALASQHRCNFCHTGNFGGADSVPRLAGQREDYLLKSLREYKSGTRREYQSVMAEVMRPLQDPDIVALAHFLARTK